VHVSELAHRFVKDPSEVVKVGDRVKVKVLNVDAQRRRIGLSVKQASAPPSPPPKQAAPANQPPQQQQQQRRDNRPGNKPQPPKPQPPQKTPFNNPFAAAFGQKK
jgi:uncharacterized protein